MGVDLIHFYNKKVNKESKIAFFVSLLFGLLVHMYKFTNTLPNHDTLYSYYSDQNVIGSGRWLLSLACGISSYFDLPWVNGIISLALIAITTIIVVDVLQIKNRFLIFLSAGLLVAYPGITETFFFEFTADGYMLAMALAALAVWFSTAKNLSVMHIVLSGICICCSCGIYQAYVSFALLLAISYFVLELLDDALSLKEIRNWIASQITIYIAGLSIYFVLWKLLMRIGGYVANAYQGVSTLAFSPLTVLHGIPNSIKALLLLFFEWNPLEHGWTLYAILNVIFLIFAGFGIVYAIVKTKLYSKAIQLVILSVSIAAIPFAACIWFFTSEGVGYRPMMLQSVCLIYILVAILYERYFPKISKNLFALLLSVIIFNNALMANISYYYMNRSYFATFSTASEMISRIHTLETNSKDIIVVGQIYSEVSLRLDPTSNKIPMLSQLLETNLMYDEIHLVNYLNETFYESFELSSYDWQADAQITQAVSQMGCWPDADSIQAIDDTIFIKLQAADSNK